MTKKTTSHVKKIQYHLIVTKPITTKYLIKTVSHVTQLQRHNKKKSQPDGKKISHFNLIVTRQEKHFCKEKMKIKR